MPINREMFPETAMVGGTVIESEIDSLVQDARLKMVLLRADSPLETWQALNDLFRFRSDVILAVDSFWARGANLSLLRHVPEVRKLCLTSPHTERITGYESLASLPHLKSLQIGSPSLKSFDVLSGLPSDRLLELRLASTLPHKPSLRVLERFKSLQVLRLEGHIDELDVIESLQSLRQLSLTGIRLNDLLLLKELPNLVSFIFQGGSVKDPSALAELEDLRHISLCPSSGFTSVDFLASLLGLEMIELQNMPKVVHFPELSRLALLRRVALCNLKRLENLEGLAKAPKLDAYSHLAVPLSWTPEYFCTLLDHPTLRQFTAITGRARKDDAILELATKMGKSPVVASIENPFTFNFRIDVS